MVEGRRLEPLGPTQGFTSLEAASGRKPAGEGILADIDWAEIDRIITSPYAQSVRRAAAGSEAERAEIVERHRLEYDSMSSDDPTFSDPRPLDLIEEHIETRKRE